MASTSARSQPSSRARHAVGYREPSCHQTVSTAGPHTISGTATDNAGNTASATSALFTIHVAKPTITVALSPPANANGWNNTPVTAHFTCTEGGGPLAGCPTDRTFSTDGPGQTTTGSVTDGFGQTASVTSAPFSIDRTKPSALSPFFCLRAAFWHHGRRTLRAPMQGLAWTRVRQMRPGSSSVRISR